jgi:hypothetical protein
MLGDQTMHSKGTMYYEGKEAQQQIRDRQKGIKKI